LTPPAPAPPAAASPPVAVAARPPTPPPAFTPDAPRPAPPPPDERPPPDAPQIQLSFLVYSRVPERRTVTFTVDGGSMVTLHEGESAYGVAVERIFSDHVQVSHRGRSFAVRPRS